MDEKEERKKVILPNEQCLSLPNYFSSLPKAKRKMVIINAPKEDLIEKIAEMCGKNKMTVRRWMYGYAQPCLAEREKIAALLQCKIEELFPPK